MNSHECFVIILLQTVVDLAERRRLIASTKRVNAFIGLQPGCCTELAVDLPAIALQTVTAGSQPFAAEITFFSRRTETEKVIAFALIVDEDTPALAGMTIEE